MKLESLQLEKFKDSSLKREQLFTLNGGGTYTDPGTICLPNTLTGVWENYNYGYDSYREGIGITYHNRTRTTTICLQPSGV